MEFATVVLGGETRMLLCFFSLLSIHHGFGKMVYLQPHELQFVQLVLYSTLACTFHRLHARQHAFPIYLKGARHQ